MDEDDDIEKHHHDEDEQGKVENSLEHRLGLNPGNLTNPPIPASP